MSRVVMKFGGASVASTAQIIKIARLIASKKSLHSEIVIVVSAMGDMTDELMGLAREISADPPKRELDMLVTAGERISISLLAIALKECGVSAISFTGSQSGIITCPSHTQAKIVEVRPKRIVEELAKGKVVIVAGFQGVSGGEITTLGRSGSDTTAVALGVALGAERVEFYKDVKGIFSADPKVDPKARHLASLTYDEALQLALKSPVLHPRCVELAKKNCIPLQVLSFDSPEGGTLIKDCSLSKKEGVDYEDVNA